MIILFINIQGEEINLYINVYYKEKIYVIFFISDIIYHTCS